MPTPIVARLTKDWSEAEIGVAYGLLCGRQRDDGRVGCGGQLGTLRSFTPRDDGTWNWTLVFGASMGLGQDGVWQLDRRARERVHHVSGLAGDPTRAPPVRARARRLLADGVHSPGFLSTRVNPSPRGVSTGEQSDVRLSTRPRRNWRSRNTQLPCEVRCPRCGGVNAVGVDMIRQAQERYEIEESWRRGP